MFKVDIGKIYQQKPANNLVYLQYTNSPVFPDTKGKTGLFS